VLSAIRGAANGGFVLGGSLFEQRIAAMAGRGSCRGKSGRPKNAVPNDDRLAI
jgi:hypothetical protein